MKKFFVVSSVLIMFSCNSNKSSETSESVAMDSTKMNSSYQPTTDTISTSLQNDSMTVKTDSVNKR